MLAMSTGQLGNPIIFFITVHTPLNQEFVLEPGNDGIIVPELLHHVEPLGPVRFYLEFYKRNPAL